MSNEIKLKIPTAKLDWKTADDRVRERLQAGGHSIASDKWSKREKFGDPEIELGEAIDALTRRTLFQKDQIDRVIQNWLENAYGRH